MTIEILAPGYCFCRLAFAAAMSDALKPETETPLEPCIRSLGKSSFRPTVTEPSALKVVLVSYPQPAAATATAAARITFAIVLGTAVMLRVAPAI